jgi:hypothetical protein
MALTPREIVKRYHKRLGKKGGLARAQKLTPERRSEIARQACQARWDRVRAKAAQIVAPAPPGASEPAA